MKDEYYLEEVIQPKEDERIITIILSCKTHGACIKIYGSPEVATERMIKVLKGLNEK